MLKNNTTPAERARGCVFSELFRDAASVARNGGDATGAPAIDKGVTLDGSTQYIDYQEAETFFVGNEISFVVEFYPAFAANDGTVDAYLFSGDGDYFVKKFGSIASNDLRIRIGNTTTDNIAIATYNQYWLVNQRNVMVVSATSGSTQVWLNSNLISNSASAWDPDPVTVLDIGVRSALGDFFEGRITKFQIYNRKLTAQEAADFYTGNIYDYRNQQSLHLPMGMAQHDPSNVRTLDVSGNARHATFGDGATPTTYPTKLGDRHGYDFDGSSDYMAVIGTGVYNSAETTIAVEFWPDFKATDAQDRFLFDSSSGHYFLIHGASGALTLKLGNTTVATPGSAAYDAYWFKGRKNIMVIVATTGSNQIWLNGVKFVDNSTVWSFTDPALIAIGINNALTGSRWFGQINSFQVWQQKLTPLQIADLTIRAGIKVNNV